MCGKRISLCVHWLSVTWGHRLTFILVSANFSSQPEIYSREIFFFLPCQADIFPHIYAVTCKHYSKLLLSSIVMRPSFLPFLLLGFAQCCRVTFEGVVHPKMKIC